MTTRQKRPVIAIVDDDPMVCRGLARLLWARGYDAVTYGSGHEFIDALGGTPALDVDCVVLDMQMPRMDGLEVQRRLTLLRPGLPVLFVSGRSGRATREAALHAGAIAFFTKPLHDEIEDFVRVLEAILRTRKRDED